MYVAPIVWEDCSQAMGDLVHDNPHEHDALGYVLQ